MPRPPTIAERIKNGDAIPVRGHVETDGRWVVAAAAEHAKLGQHDNVTRAQLQKAVDDFKSDIRSRVQAGAKCKIEEHHAIIEDQVPAFLFPAMKAHQQWGGGKLVTASEFETVRKAVLDVRIGVDASKEPEPKPVAPAEATDAVPPLDQTQKIPAQQQQALVDRTRES